jgi:hypothetical protein
MSVREPASLLSANAGMSPYRIGQIVGAVCVVAIAALAIRRRVLRGSVRSRSRPFSSRPDSSRVMSVNSQVISIAYGQSRGRRLVFPAWLLGMALVVALVAYLTTPQVADNAHAVAGSPPPARRSAPPGSLARLETIVVQPGDLSSDWTAQPYHDDSHGDTGDAAFLSCAGVKSTATDGEIATANSDDYYLANMVVSSSATSYRSESEVQSDFALVRSRKFSSCLNQLMTTLIKAGMPRGATINAPSFVMKPGSAGQPSNVAASGSGSVRVSLAGRSITLYMAMAFISGPRIEAFVSALNLQTPVPAPLMNRLTANVAARAARG